MLALATADYVGNRWLWLTNDEDQVDRIPRYHDDATTPLIRRSDRDSLPPSYQSIVNEDDKELPSYTAAVQMND